MMRRSIFVLLVCMTTGCKADSDAGSGHSADPGQRYASIVTESCVEQGRLGASPESLARNCRCVADSLSRFVPADMQARTVQAGRFDDSDWAQIKGTPAENKIAESLYQDCSMSYALAYALFEQWP
jgi:hypothetical protein